VFVCVGDAFVKLLFELVLFSVGVGIADTPEVLDELFSLVVSGEFFKGVALGLREDWIVVVDPVPVGFFDFGFDVALFFVRTRACVAPLSVWSN
jgi:hypothetical protein